MSVVNKLVDKISEFIRLKGERLKLEVIGQVSKLLAQFIAIMTIGVIFVFMLIFLAFALSAYLNTVLNSPSLGYLVVAGVFFLVMMLVIALLRTRKLQRWLEALFVGLNETLSEKNDD